jgi:serine/threonine-protein kinase
MTRVEIAIISLAFMNRTIGRYELHQKIGEGGGGVVWKAWDSVLHRWVALKEPRFGAGYPRERFLQEARVAARLKHPHLVQVFEVLQHEDTDFIVMDYVQGRTLDKAGVSLREAASILADVAAAVDYMHASGIVHRDVKPENIILDSEGKPHLADFGIAKIAGDKPMTLQGSVLGTPEFMAPEQATGNPEDVSPRTDVYGLGATLYFCITGKPPLDGFQGLQALLETMLHQKPVPPRVRNPDVPVELEVITMRALEKIPSQRYPSAAAVGEDLRRYLRGEPIQARPISPIQHAANWARRHGRALAIVAVLAALIAAAAYRQIAVESQMSELLQSLTSKVERDIRHYEDDLLQPPHDMSATRQMMARTERDLEELLARYPQAGEASILMGRLRAYLGDYDKAESLITRGLQSLGSQARPSHFVERARVFIAKWELADGEADAYLEQAKLDVERAVQLGFDSGTRRLASAEIQFALGKIEECRASCLKLIADRALDPHSLAESWILLARTHRKNYAHVDEIEAYSRANALRRSDAKAYVGAARARISLTKTDLHAASDSIGKGMSEIDSALAIHPESAPAWATRGDLLRQVAKDKMRKNENPLAELEQAAQAVRNALKFEPDSPSAYNALGSTYLRMAEYSVSKQRDPSSDLTSAIEAYQKAKGGGSQNNLALALIVKSRFRVAQGEDPIPDLDQALRHLDECLKDQPDHPLYVSNAASTHLRRARVLRRTNASRAMEAVDRSISLYQRLIELKKEYPHAVADAARAYRFRSQMKPDPRPDLDQALKLLGEPKDAEGLAALAEVYSDSNPEKAIEYFGRALEYESARTGRGEAYLRLGKLDAARADFEAALQRDPASIEALIGLGKCRLKSSLRDALEPLNRALELSKRHPDALAVRGECHFLLGNAKEAAEDLRAASEGDSAYANDPKIQSMLKQTDR